jgi:putative membrane protein
MQIQTSVILGVCGLILCCSSGEGQTANLSRADKQFIDIVATTDMIQAHEGQMAENQAHRADVKDLAKALIQDHTDSYAHLTELAAKSGVSIPTGINAARNREIRQLVLLKGARFDVQFDRDEILDHRRVIAVFKREAAHGQDADVKAYATKMIPILEKHLNLAEQCARQARHG